MAYSNMGTSSSSLAENPEVIKEMYCEHCDRHEKKYEPAGGFCEDCEEFLCDTCLKYHKRYVPNHSMQDKDSMPQNVYFEKCSFHPDRIVKFFCGNCQNFTCSFCNTLCHRKCANISHLSKLVQGIEHCTELKDLTSDLDKLSQEIEQTEEQVNHNLQTVVTQETKTLATTRKLKENFMVTYKNHQQDTIDTFDQKMKDTIAKLKEERTRLVEKEAEKQKEFEKKLRDDETSVTDKVANIRDSDQKALQSIQGKSLKMKKNLKALSSDLVQQQKTSQRCKLFMTMKKGIQEREKLKTGLVKVKGSCDIHYYIVKSEVEELDVLSLQNAKRYFSFNEMPSSKQRRSATQYSDIKIKVSRASSYCLLDESTLVVADFNECLHVVIRNVNVETEPYSTIQIPSKPWGITKIEDNKVAVTCPNVGLVRLITFSESMTELSTDDITVGAGCHGIAYSNNNLIVSYDTKPGKVQLLNMSGYVLKCFDTDCNGKPLFITPHYLALSPDNTTMYVSDKGNYTVTSITLDGKVMATYRDGELKGPCQLTVDGSGTVFVCGMLSNNVHQLSSNLTKVKILLDIKQDIHCPETVAYCQKTSRLYVGIRNSSSIKVFKLSLK